MTNEKEEEGGGGGGVEGGGVGEGVKEEEPGGTVKDDGKPSEVHKKNNKLQYSGVSFQTLTKSGFR